MAYPGDLPFGILPGAFLHCGNDLRQVGFIAKMIGELAEPQDAPSTLRPAFFGDRHEHVPYFPQNARLDHLQDPLIDPFQATPDPNTEVTRMVVDGVSSLGA